MPLVVAGNHARGTEADDIERAVIVDVGKLAVKDIVATPTLVLSEGLHIELRRFEAAIAPAISHIGAQDAEADDVGPAVTVHISDVTGEVALAGPTLILAEVAQRELRSLEGAVPVRQRDQRSRDAEADDIVEAIAIHVGDLAVEGIVTPPALRHAEIGDREFHGLEGAVAIAERNQRAGGAESDDIRLAVTVDVADRAGEAFLRRPALVGAEVRNAGNLVGKGAVGPGEGDKRAGGAKADDVGSAVAVHVDELAVELIVAPPAGGLPEVGDHQSGGGEAAAG